MSVQEREPRLGSPVAKARSRPAGVQSLLEPVIVRRALRGPGASAYVRSPA